MAGRQDRILVGAILMLTLALGLVVADVFRERLVKSGDKAPDFSIVTDDGRKVTPHDFGGKLLVLNFWATWCDTCIQEIPSLNQFARDMAPEGVVVLGVSVDKNEANYRRFLKQAGLKFLTARDPEANISTEYGTFKFPETYLIDSKGRVVEKYVSNVPWTDPQIVQRVRAAL